MLCGQILAAGVAFAVNLLAATVMTPTERGELALLLQLTYMLSVVAILGVERPFIASQSGDFSTMISRFVRLLRPGWWSASVPLLAALYFLVQGRLTLVTSCVILVLYLVCNTLVRAIRAAYIASGELRYFVWSAVVTQVALLIFALGLTILNVGDTNIWFAGYALTSLVAVAIVFISRNRSLEGSVRRDPELSEIRRRGLRLLPASFGNTAMLRSDRLLLPLLASSAQLGIYVVVATVMEIATWPVQQWVDSSLKKWSTSEAQSRRSALLLILKAGILVLALSVVLGSLAYFVVHYLLPPAYAASASLIVPLGASAVFYGMSRVQQGLLIANGHSGRVSGVEISGLLASVVFYVLLIPSMGAAGAAVGSLLGYASCFAVGAVVLFGKSPRRESGS